MKRDWDMFWSGGLLILAFWQFWAGTQIDHDAYPPAKAIVSLVFCVFFLLKAKP